MALTASNNVSSGSNSAGPEGVSEKAHSFIVRINGAYFEGVNGATSNVDYGGASNAGGALGNSAQAVIQACINNLPSTGGTVFLRTGVYPLGSTSILITSPHIKLMGENFACVTITSTGAKTAIHVNNTFDVTIQELTVNWVGTGSPAGSCGISINSSGTVTSYCYIRNCVVAFYDTGIYVGLNSGNFILDCMAQYCYNSGFSINSTDNEIYNSHAGWCDVGFNISYSTNYFSQCQSWGNGLTTRNSKANQHGWVIGSSAAHTRCVNCESDSNGGFGFLIKTQYAILSACYAHNNGLQISPALGFGLYGASHCTLQGCTSASNCVKPDSGQSTGSGIGIGEDEGADYNVIEGCHNTENTLQNWRLTGAHTISRNNPDDWTGLVTTPFTDKPSSQISLWTGTTATPTSGVTYQAIVYDWIISTSGGSDVGMYLYDANGNVVAYYSGAAANVLVPRMWKVRFQYNSPPSVYCYAKSS